MFMKLFQILSIFAILGNCVQAINHDNDEVSGGSKPFKLIVSRSGSDIQHARIGSYKHEFAISSDAHKISAHIDESLKLVINNTSMYAKVHADGSLSISKHVNIASHGFAIKNGRLSYIGSEGFTAVPKTFGYSILFDPLEKEEMQVPGSIPVTIEAIGENGDVVPDYPIKKDSTTAHSKNKRQTEITINPVAPPATTSTFTSITGTTVVTRTECSSGNCPTSTFNASSVLTSSIHSSSFPTSSVPRSNTSTITSVETRSGTTIFSSVVIPTTANFINSTTETTTNKETLTTREISTSVQPIFMNTTSIVSYSNNFTSIATAPTTLISSFTFVVSASSITSVVSGTPVISVIPPSTIVSALTFTTSVPSETVVFTPVTVTESCPLCIPVTVSISGTVTTTITATSTPAPMQSVLTTSITERTTTATTAVSSVSSVSVVSTEIAPIVISTTATVSPVITPASSLSSSSLEAQSTTATLVTFSGAANNMHYKYVHNNVFGTGIVGLISGMIIAFIF
ncbi:hypothetical protein ACO0QE_001100 [Hanseniaspora vineae]